MQFVVTKVSDLDPRGPTCSRCGKLLAVVDQPTNVMTPSFEELFAAGAVPVPNFGWFCGQDCADIYERETGIRFRRDLAGRVTYYLPDLTPIHPWSS